MSAPTLDRNVLELDVLDETDPLAAAVPPSLARTRPDWHDDPRLPCRTDPEMWYSDIHVEREQAALTCRTACPRVTECLAGALVRREPFGVWGGQTAAQRRSALVDLLGEQNAPADPDAQADPDTIVACGHRLAERRYRGGDRGHYCNGCDRERAARTAAERRAGTWLPKAQRTARDRDALMSAYHELAPRRFTLGEAAQALGVSEAKLTRLMSQARAAGDPRAVLHTTKTERNARRHQRPTVAAAPRRARSGS